MTFIGVDRDYVQDLEDKNGFGSVTRPLRQIMRSLGMMSSATTDRSLALHWVRLGNSLSDSWLAIIGRGAAIERRRGHLGYCCTV
jgi:hypothetical protein